MVEAVKVSDFKGGIKRPTVRTGKIDRRKTISAKKAESGANYDLTAGMLIDPTQQTAPYQTGYTMDTYRSSYAYGLGDRSGTYDVPTYFARMNDNNGGKLYFPVTLREKYSWYRYWATTDAYVGRALDLLSDLPMSKLSLNMPKAKGKLTKKKRIEIKEFFENQCRVLDMFTLCQSIIYEMNVIGNCHVFHEWDAEKKMWSSAVMLPPEEVSIFEYPFTREKRVEYRPRMLMEMILGSRGFTGGDASRADLNEKILEGIPPEITKMVTEEKCIVMDSDPAKGSFSHHFHRKKPLYMDLAPSVLERVLVPMLLKEHYRYTQLSLASRNMTPKNLITAPQALPEDIDDLREQVDMSYLDPDYTVMTNFDVTWEQIGAQDRLINLDSEYERIESQVFSGLGVTRELLTGESTYSGSRITVDILNTMFLGVRETLKTYIEEKLFIPICEAHGWYEMGENDIKKYWYPQIGFNRLTIRDNAEVFDSLYQLYLKGSLPVDTIYELFNLNPDEIEETLKKDMFTVKDANFNRALEEIASGAGQKVADSSDAAKKLADYMGLKFEEPVEDEGGFGGFEDEPVEGEVPADGEVPAEEPPMEEADVAQIVETVLAELPEGASEEDAVKVVENL